ncbi:MAG: hypothetical protein D6694_13680 [Gammaproteobacteria bacterium]|nr:MAG: hypothetical protein D6694_13680 [Gammaproteobacteria bacterium]
MTDSTQEEEDLQVIARLKDGRSTGLTSLRALIRAITEELPIERVYVWKDVEGGARLVDIGTIVATISLNPSILDSENQKSSEKPKMAPESEKSSDPTPTPSVPQNGHHEPSRAPEERMVIDKVIPAKDGGDGVVIDSEGRKHRSLLSRLGFSD